MREIKYTSLESRELWSRDATTYDSYIQEELNDFHKKVWQDELLKVCSDKNARILDIGTGPGFFPVILGELGYHVTGIDLAGHMMEIARINIKKAGLEDRCSILERDALHTEFEQDSFDLIINRNVTWTLEDPQRAYREWKRILRPGGKLLIFDSPWFHYLWDEAEDRKRKEFLAEYHERTGEIHDSYEENNAEDPYRKGRPLSAVIRPRWDLDMLMSLGFQHAEAAENVGDYLYSEEEQYRYSITPMFRILAVK